MVTSPASFFMAASGGQAPFDSTLIGNSVWLNGSDEDIKREGFTLSSDGQKEFIISMWVNFNEFGRAQQLFIIGNPTGITSFNDGTQCTLNADHTITLSIGNGGSSGGQIKTNRLFRDIGWYHLLFSFNSNTSVSSKDRLQLYVNGIRESSLATNTAVPDNQDVRGSLTGNVDLRFGRNTHPSLGYFYKGYYAQVCYLEGKSIQAGDFAVSDFLDTFTMGTNGSQFIPKKNSEIAALATTAGGNSACLDFANSSDLGNDISGNNKDFTATNMAAANQSENTPSLVYPVVNVLRPAISGKTFSEGNLKVSSTSAFGQGNVLTTFPLSKGAKWYWEIIDAAAAANQTYGIAKADAVPSATGLGGDTKAWGFYNNQYRHNGNIGAVPDSPTNTGTRYMFAVDVDAGKFWMGNDGTWWKPVGGSTAGDPAAGTNPAFTDTDIAEGDTFPALDLWSSDSATFVFDEDDFAHTIPTGFNYLNSSNLTAPDYQGIDYFDATIYEGNGDNQRVGDFVPFTDTYTVDKSAMWNSADLRRLSITYSSQPAATSDNSSDAAVYRKASLSFWIKFLDYPDSSANHQTIISQANSAQNNRFLMLIDNPQSTNSVLIMLNSTAGTDGAFYFDKNLFSGQEWSHFLLHLDTNNATAADRMKVWINGNAVTSTNDYTGMTQGLPLNLFQDEELLVGHLSPTSAGYTANYNFNSYLAELHLIDGSCQAVTNFGQVDTSTNRWVAKDYKTNVGTYGNRGFYLEFDGTPGAGSGSDMGKDSSGKGNHLAEAFGSGGSAWADGDQFTDTPSKNFNVFDGGLNGVGTLNEGNTQMVTATDQRTTYTTMNIPATGKWYWEVDITNYVPGNASMFGIVEFDNLVTTNNPVSSLGRQVVFDNYAGNAYVYSSTSLGTAWCNTPGNDNFNADGDILQFALDQDAGTLFIGNNNTWFRAGGARDTFANATTVGQQQFKTGVKRRFLLGRGGSTAETYAINFGQQANTFSGSSTTFNAAADGHFVYTPPTGYKAVNQDNLDDTASKITAWSWIKNRDASDNHMLIDRVRGIGKDVHSNSANAEATNVNTVQRFLQRGVQVGSDVEVNTASESFVLWQWLAGDSATTGTVFSADNPPSLASTVIAADADHFSVGTYTGDGGTSATIKHGLSAAPEMIWVKNRSQGDEWLVGTEYNGYTSPWNYYAHLETAGNFAANSNAWNNTEPSTSAPFVFTVGTSDRCNASGENYVFYCFRSVPGVCKVGSYIGNGDGTGSDTVDGPYISTGFKPKWLLVKWTQGGSLSGEGWLIKDTSRQVINPNDDADIYANGTTENAGATHGADILADGFKIRGGGGANNKLNATYLYLAMAEIGGNGTLPPIYGR